MEFFEILYTFTTCHQYLLVSIFEPMATTTVVTPVASLDLLILSKIAIMRYPPCLGTIMVMKKNVSKTNKHSYIKFPNDDIRDTADNDHKIEDVPWIRKVVLQGKIVPSLYSQSPNCLHYEFLLKFVSYDNMEGSLSRKKNRLQDWYFLLLKKKFVCYKKNQVAGLKFTFDTEKTNLL